MKLSRAACLPLIFLLSSAPCRAQDEALTCAPGAWGDLEYYEFLLEPPRSHIGQKMLRAETHWPFPAANVEEVYALLEKAGLSSDAIKLAREKSLYLVKDGITLLNPPAQVIAGLTEEQRLALSKIFLQANPFLFENMLMGVDGGDFAKLAPDLPPSQIDLVKSLIYQDRGTAYLFDRPYLMSKLPTEEERLNVMRALCRNRSLVVNLKVSDTTDIKALSKYWTAGGLNPGAESVLRGAQSTPGIERVDIIHLLPPVARKYLYTYPKSEDRTPVEAPDCFWASLNFFNKEPSRRTLDDISIAYHLEDDFVAIPPPYQFGDLILLTQKGTGEFIHSYIYIADDVVFTKNGRSMVWPFTLSLREDMLSLYRPAEGFNVQGFRHRRPMQLSAQ